MSGFPGGMFHSYVLYMESVRSLEEFYTLNRELRDVRRSIVRAVLSERPTPAGAVGALETVRERIESMPKTDGRYRLPVSTGSDLTLTLEPDYELAEIRKDFAFLRNPPDRFIDILAREFFSGDEREFSVFLEEGKKLLGRRRFRTMLADRDGTLNNYCGRYRSSIQAVWNAVFLTRFARGRCETSVILTSAPLTGGGLLDVSVAPDRVFTYAGSAGREYLTADGRTERYLMTDRERELMERLAERVRGLVSRQEFRVFTLIGSGLQFKEGQVTLARQDIHGTVPERRSGALRDEITGIIRGLDPEERLLRLEDTGMDLEIVLAAAGPAAPEDARSAPGGTQDAGSRADSSAHRARARGFDKGDGVRFLDERLGLELELGGTLVCGDTGSDLPMARYAVEQAADTVVVFVTRDDALAREVRELSPDAFIVPSPDILVSILNPGP